MKEITFLTLMCWNKDKWCPKDIIKIICKLLRDDVPVIVKSPYANLTFASTSELFHFYINVKLFDFIPPRFKASNGLTLYNTHCISQFRENELFFDMAQCHFRGLVAELQNMNFYGVKDAIRNWQAITLALKELEESFISTYNIKKSEYVYHSTFHNFSLRLDIVP